MDRRRHFVFSCTRRRAQLGLFVACITVTVLGLRLFFLGRLSGGGGRSDSGSGGRGVLALVQSATGGLLVGASNRRDAAKLPLFDALVVYDAVDVAAGSSETAAGNRAKLADLTSNTAVTARGGIVPILVIAGCRPRMLRRALLSLLTCDGVTPGLVLVSIDAQRTCGGAAARVAKEFGVRSVSRQNQQYFESGSKRIARHYKWSLHRALGVLEPHAPAIVVVEEDLLFSVDFYTYMLSSLSVIQGGSSSDSAHDDGTDRPWTASGWNDNGYAGRVRDPSAIRLSSFFPGLGWILTRKIWDEALGPAWPDDHWDHWMREKSTMRSHNVVVPEVNRVFHAGVDGVFMNTRMHMKLFHYIAPYGGSIGINFDMSTVASSTQYRQHLVQRMSAAIPLSSARQLFQQVHAATLIGEKVPGISNTKPSTSGTDVVVWVKVGEISTWCNYFGLWPLSDASGLRSAFSGVIEFYWDQPIAAIKDDEAGGGGGSSSDGLHVYLVQIDSTIATDVARASKAHAAVISNPLSTTPLSSTDGHAAWAKEASSRFDWPSDGGYHRVRGYVRPHIPRIVHQTWKTTDESQWSPTMKDSVSSWRLMNPSYKLKFWDDDAAADFVSTHFPGYKEAYVKSPIIQKADLFRYLVLLKEGGVYADTDVLCKVPIDLWPSVDFTRIKVIHKTRRLRLAGTFFDQGIALGSPHRLAISSQPLRLLIGIELDDFDTALKPMDDTNGGTVDSPCRSRSTFSQWTMASAPGHPAMRRVAENVKARINSKYNTFLLEKWKRTGDLHAVTGETVFTTGPCAWTEAISIWLKETHGLDWRTLREAGLDHIVGDMEIFGGRAIYDELVEHKFAGSWKIGKRL